VSDREIGLLKVFARGHANRSFDVKKKKQFNFMRWQTVLFRQDHQRNQAKTVAAVFGAGYDFLPSVGHQSNPLVMGLGGYPLGNYWKLELPLSVMVVLDVPLWPFH